MINRHRPAFASSARRSRSAPAAAAPGRLGARGPALIGLAVVLAVKLVVVAQLASHPLLQPHGVLDDAVYVKLAHRVAAGDLVLGPEIYYVSPLYTYFLGAILGTGGTLLAARVVQVVLGTIAVALVGLTARRWFGLRAGVSAAVVAAATGLFTFNEILVLQSALDPILTALALWLIARAMDGGRTPAFALAGGAFGLLVLNRPNALAVVLALPAVWLFLRRSRIAARQAGVLMLGALLVLSPVAVRNRLVAGEWALTSHGGLNFYIGNHQGASGTWAVVPGISPSIDGQARDVVRAASLALGRPASSGEASNHYYLLGLRWMADHPADAARLWVRKAALTLSATDLALNYSYTYYARDESSLLSLLVGGPWLVVPLGLVGLVLGLKTHGRAFAAWAAFVPVYAGSLVIFFVSSRYRLPLMLALCVPVGHAVNWSLAALTGRRWSRLAVAGGAVGAISAVVWLPLEPDTGRMHERTERMAQLIASRADERAMVLLEETEGHHPAPALLFYRAGRGYQDRGENERAIGFFERALAADPGQPDIRFSLGEALLAANRPVEAAPHLAAALRAGIEPPAALRGLVHAYRAAGRDDQAAAVFADAPLEADAIQALALAEGAEALAREDTKWAERVARAALTKVTTSGGAHELLGMALMLQDRPAEGESALEEAVRLAPASATAQFHLGLALAARGASARAAVHVREALRLRPDYREARELAGRLPPAR